MLNFAAWNIRGLNQPHKQEEVRKFISSSRLSLLGILETKVRYGRRSHLARELLPGWSFLYNYNVTSHGRIWATWDPSVLSIQLLRSSVQLLHLSVSVKETHHFCICAELWAGESSIVGGDQLHSPSAYSQPWIILGDFNVVRHVSEKAGGDLSWTTEMDDFNTCCQSADLEDLKFSGHWFTWSNKSPSNPISRKLDRVLINPS